MRQADAVSESCDSCEEKYPKGFAQGRSHSSCEQGTDWRTQKRRVRDVAPLCKDEEEKLFKQLELGKKAYACLCGSVSEAEAGVFAPGFGALDASLRRELCTYLSQCGKDAKNRLITASLPQVTLLAEKAYRMFCRKDGTIGEDDLFSVGCLALEDALRSFKREKGTRLKTYAEKAIARAMLRFIRGNDRNVRVPAWVRELAAKAEKARVELASELKREPSCREVAERTGITEEKLFEAELFCLEEASLDAPQGEDGASAFSNLLQDRKILSPEALVERREARRLTKEILDELEPRERAAVKMRLGIGSRRRTFREIGAELGLSPEGARKLYIRAKGKACRGAKERGLEAFLQSA